MNTLDFPITSQRPSIFGDLDFRRDKNHIVWLLRRRFPSFCQVLHVHIRLLAKYKLLARALGDGHSMCWFLRDRGWFTAAACSVSRSHVTATNGLEGVVVVRRLVGGKCAAEERSEPGPQEREQHGQVGRDHRSEGFACAPFTR